GAEATAQFAQEVRTRASENLASVERDTLLQASVGETQATVAILEQAVATDLAAVVQTTQQLEATVGQNTSAIQTTQQAQATMDGKLQAMYSVKLGVTADGKYYAAGMGIGIENTPDGMQSQVLFQADRFAVINVANGQITTPFVIQGGQVFMNTAIIGEGTITMAKIADALQSTNYVAGETGWRLDKAGTLEINGTVAGGGRMTINNQWLRLYHPNGVKGLELGIG
ncbi:DUF1983 domain-containing protein, partial [Pseudomonas sp. KSR10]|uniref:DUF1983 domain-containing protein n=1 Tax=Pseudomonas sp. KSR10 TaxID=2916654 RepID=UPI001EF7DEB7